MRAALLLSTLALGCSLLATRAPPDDWEESRPVDCKSSTLAAVADGAVAATGLILSGLATAYMVDTGGCHTGESDGDDDRGDCGILIPVAVGSGLGGAGYAFSAWRGGRNTVACDEAGGRHSRWLEAKRAHLPEEPVARPPPPPPDAGPPPPPDAGAPDAAIADAVVP